MLVKLFPNFRLTKLIASKKYTFSTLEASDYYSLLQVKPDATIVEINDAFAQLGRHINPDNNPTLFKKINEAFIILQDPKSRDAYDSLLKVKKTSYLDQQYLQTRSVVKKSYLAARKRQTAQNFRQKFNMDEFGRYKGGLPKKRGFVRGTAMDQPGIFHSPIDLQNANPASQYPAVDSMRAESFKNFHQDEREARNMRWPWFKYQVDYNFFRMMKLQKMLPTLQWLFVFFVALPIFARFLMNESRLNEENKMRKKANLSSL